MLQTVQWSRSSLRLKLDLERDLLRVEFCLPGEKTFRGDLDLDGDNLLGVLENLPGDLLTYLGGVLENLLGGVLEYLLGGVLDNRRGGVLDLVFLGGLILNCLNLFGKGLTENLLPSL